VHAVVHGATEQPILRVVLTIEANSLLHVLVGSNQLRKRPSQGWADNPSKVFSRWAFRAQAPQGVLIRSDNPRCRVVNGAIKVNQDCLHGGSRAK
jgi:hypothetical protein